MEGRTKQPCITSRNVETTLLKEERAQKDRETDAGIITDPQPNTKKQNCTCISACRIVVPVLNYLRTMPWRRMEKWRYSSNFLDLGTRWRWAVRFTPLPLYPPGKSPAVSIGQEAGWSPESVWTLWRREKSFNAGNRTQTVQPVARRYTDWAILIPSHILAVRLIQEYVFPSMSRRHNLTCSVFESLEWQIGFY
jgi:hypothetical protein